MKKNIVLTMLTLLMMTTLILSVPAVLAGNKNQNDDLAFAGKSVERGTGKVNGIDGCAPPTQSGDEWVYMAISEEELTALNVIFEPDIISIEWKGGPCCPSNVPSDSFTFLNDHQYPLPNQCCNPPNMGPAGSGVPGNHCVCFELRGYPFPNAQ